MARLRHWKQATVPITASKGARKALLPGRGWPRRIHDGLTNLLESCQHRRERLYTRLHVTLIAWIAVSTPVRKVPGAESPDSRLSQRPAVVAFELLEQVSGLLCLGEPGKVRAPLQHKIQQIVRGSRGRIQCATKPKKQLGVVRCSQTGRAPAELADQSEALAATHARTAAALLTLRLGHHTPGRRRYRQRSGRGPPAPGLTPNLRCPCAAAVECTRWRRAQRFLPAALEAWRQVPEARGSSSRPPSSRARRLVVAEWRSESPRQSTAEWIFCSNLPFSNYSVEMTHPGRPRAGPSPCQSAA